MEGWRYRLLQLSRRLWVRAAAYAALGVVVALAAALLAPFVPDAAAERFGGAGLESLLGILASSLLAVATFSVGAMITAYTSVSSSVTPRVAALITSDRGAQTALATFVGGFLFSVVALVALSAEYYGREGRAILFLATLAMIAVVAMTLLRWIDRLSELARLGHALDRLEDETDEALRRRARSPRLGGSPVGAAPETPRAVRAGRAAYVENIDVPALQSLAQKEGRQMRLEVLPGAFVGVGDILAHASGPPLSEEACEAVLKAFVMGRTRSFDQDPRFGLVVLGEVAGRALSPGINDPGTAIDVVGRGARLLSRWAAEPEDSEPDCDLIFAPALSAADLVDDVFGPIMRYGAAHRDVAVRLSKALESLAGLPHAELAAAAAAFRRDALERSLASMDNAADAAYLRAAAGRP